MAIWLCGAAAENIDAQGACRAEKQKRHGRFFPIYALDNDDDNVSSLEFVNYPTVTAVLISVCVWQSGDTHTYTHSNPWTQMCYEFRTKYVYSYFSCTLPHRVANTVRNRQ